MSNYEWTKGRVNLPAACLATVKREFRRRHNDGIEKAYDTLKRFRLNNLTSSRPKWSAAIEAFDNQHTSGRPGTKPRPDVKIAMQVARSLERPRAVKWEDFTLPGCSKATVTEDTFPLRSEVGDVIGEVVFDGRIMTWSVFEGNHAVDTFRDSPDYDFLCKVLEGIVWTRGSGGGVTYCSEHQDPTVEQRFGPAGRRYTTADSPPTATLQY